MHSSADQPNLGRRGTLRPRSSTRGYHPSGRAGRGRKGGRGRIQKQRLQPRTHIRSSYRKDIPSLGNGDHARDAESPTTVSRSETPTGEVFQEDGPYSCTEASLLFIEFAGLKTDEDTKIIALNLMDFFLSDENWLPELSYCKLHAACFYFASCLTGNTNTIQQVAESLGPDSAFVQLASSTAAEDEDTAAAIQYAISVTASDIEDGYTLLYERKEELGALMGQYAAGLGYLYLPSQTQGAKELAKLA